MGKEERLLNFYIQLVTLSQKDLRSGSLFFEQAITSMIMGHEYGANRLCSEETYEKIMLWNLAYNSREAGNLNKEVILDPFCLLDDDNYYSNLLTKDIVSNSEILMLCRLTSDLEVMDESSLAIQLLKIKDKDFILAYQTISKLKEIFRKGWIRRNVQKEYIEDDAVHTMQMFSLASAYFRVYGADNFACNKTLEMILIHEIGEVLADDIVEGSKEHATKHAIEYEAVKQVFSPLKKGAYFISLWEEFEDRKTKNAQFVYEIDKMDPILKALYLDFVLNREDLFEDFYLFEKNRGTFEGGYLHELFQFIGNQYLKEGARQKAKGIKTSSVR